MSLSEATPGVRTSGGRVVAVTGANGYIGGLVCERFRAAGWTVIQLQRQAPPSSPTVRPFVLGEAVAHGVLAGVDVLVHCAYDMTLTKPADVTRVNVDGTKALVEAAQAQGIGRIVLISSMSAYWGTEQTYGRAKLACEEAVAAVGGVSVRLGLVYGDHWGGMAGSLRKLTALPVTPLVGVRTYQYTVHERDAVEGLFAIGTAPEVPPGLVVGLANTTRVPFRTLLEGIARRSGSTVRFVPIPWRPVFAAMWAAERLGVKLPLRSDSLLGLVRPAGFVPESGVWPSLDVDIRPFALDPSRT
jgi:nucleoside-diphosphate-sugar epimerase